MSSSTSSSDRLEPRGEPAARWPDRRVGKRVALVVLAAFAVLEALVGGQLFKRSKDFSNFMSFDERSARLVDEPVSVAFIGNSATLRGVEPHLVGGLLTSRCGVPVSADLFTADASRVNTWRYILESAFWQPGRAPTLFVITFYEDDLADGNRIEIGRVAQFFTTWRNWPEVFDVDLHSFGQRAEFLVSSFWATYAARARLRERALGILPGHDEYLVHTNGILYRHERAAATSTRRATTHVATERLLARAREEKSRILFVAYPTLESARGNPYPLDPATRSVLRAAGAELLDLRRLEEIPPELYEDDIHLGEEGRARYSRILSTVLPCPR